MAIRCPDCDYVLTVRSGRRMCPECGQVYLRPSEAVTRLMAELGAVVVVGEERDQPLRSSPTSIEQGRLL
jgi:uncharacterized Zn finger protein (UPF0148 family)